MPSSFLHLPFSTSFSPAWPFAFARVKGTHHRKFQKTCQDFGAWIFEEDPFPFLIVALADGAGSAHLSHEGASKRSEERKM